MPKRVVLLVGCLSLLSMTTRAADLSVIVEWDQPVGKTATGHHYGTNLFLGTDPAIAGKDGIDAYKKGVATLRTSFVRLHTWEMMGDSSKTAKGWLREPTAAGVSWDRDRITAALADLPRAGQTWMINIPSWPVGIANDKVPLPREQYDRFAQFCADLVKLVNVDLRKGVLYWEVLNERDDMYKGQAAEMGELFLHAARAMKKVDPTIKVGGPAFTHPWHETLSGFLGKVAGEIDFVSYHSYVTGKVDEPKLPDLLAGAAGMGSGSDFVAEQVAKVTQRPVELFHNEYNISWAPPDPRMNDVTSALYDALAMRSFVLSRATGAMSWHEAGGWYGKLDGDYKPRPSAHVHGLFNQHLRGAVVRAVSSDDSRLTPFAVQGTGTRAIALMHRHAGGATSVRLLENGGGNVRYTVHEITNGEPRMYPLPAAAATTQGFTVPASSVLVLVAEPSVTTNDAGVVADSARPAEPADAGSPSVDARPAASDAAVRRDAGSVAPPSAPQRRASGGCTVGTAPPASSLLWLLALLLPRWRRRA